MSNAYTTPKTTGLICFILGISSLFNNTMAMEDQRVKLSHQLIKKGARLSFNKPDGKLRFLGSLPNQAITITGTSPAMSAEQNARIVMNTYGKIFGIDNADKQLRTIKQKQYDSGKSMVRYQQLHNGVPVLGGELIVNLDNQQRLISVNGETSSIKNISTTTPTISTEQASVIAINTIAKIYQVHVDNLVTTPPKLSLYDPRLISSKSTPAELVWQMEVTDNSDSLFIREFVLINALNGRMSLHFNQIHHAKDRQTFDANNSPLVPVIPDCTEIGCVIGSSTDTVQAHQFVGDTYDFFYNVHGRDSLDGNGGTIRAIINLCLDIPGIPCPMDNAFWDGQNAAFGQGYAMDDVVAHELTHAFTEYTSNLLYYYQSGAINESLSDLWGEFVDIYNGISTPAEKWLLGEETPSGALRSLSDPAAYGDPDSMSSPNYYRGEDDSGGVHTNSGINNKAVYLMAEPSNKTFRTFDGPGIGIEKVARIYYQAQTGMLTSGADYADLYNAVIQACSNLQADGVTTANDCQIVKQALDAVEMNTDPMTNIPPVVPFNPDAPLCETMLPRFVFLDDFEKGFDQWTFETTPSGNAHDWQHFMNIFGTSYATSGIHSLFGEAIDSAKDQYAMISVNIPAGTHYLRFNHAYDFEFSSTFYFDGGVVEYSTDNGLNWADINSLLSPVEIQGQDYNGTISITDSSNTLENSPAFVGLSHGFVSTRYKLSSLSGQSVQFRWRIATDASSPPELYGWILDDVMVYSCNNTAPTAPLLTSPADNAAFIASDVIDFQWIDGEDNIDGDAVTHTVLVCRGKDCLPNIPYTQFAVLTKQTPILAGLGAGSLLLLGVLTIGWRRQAYLLIGFGCILFLSTSCGRGSSQTTVIGETPKPTVTSYRWRVAANDGHTVTYSSIRNYTITTNN